MYEVRITFKSIGKSYRITTNYSLIQNLRECQSLNRDTILTLKRATIFLEIHANCLKRMLQFNNDIDITTEIYVCLHIYNICKEFISEIHRLYLETNFTNYYSIEVSKGLIHQYTDFNNNIMHFIKLIDASINDEKGDELCANINSFIELLKAKPKCYAIKFYKTKLHKLKEIINYV